MIKLSRRHLLTGLTSLAAWPARVWAHMRPQREVLAFYYGWYGQGPHVGPFPDIPVGGDYDSLDAAVLSRQVAQAKAAGITGLIASWWGQNDRTDRQLPLLLDACAKHGLRVTAYIERANTVEEVAADTLYVYKTFGRHPAWLTCGGKPVIFYFDRLLQNLGLEGWDRARALVESHVPQQLAFIGTANTTKEINERKTHFDALHIYSMQFEAAHPRLFEGLWRQAFYASWVRAQSGAKVTTATVLPGYDDHLLPERTGKRPIVNRGGGATYRRLWQAAIAAKTDWILIVSFNEWHEASQIEPSLQFGDRELATTKEMAEQFMA